MKKLIIALIGTGLFLSSNLLASSSNCANTGYTNTGAPKFCGGFYIGVTGYYLQPTTAHVGLNSIMYSFGDYLAPIDSSEYQAVLARFKPDYRLDWEVKVGYEIPCTANNIELSYFNLRNTDDVRLDFSSSPANIADFFFDNLLIMTMVGLPVEDYVNNIHLRYEVDKIDLNIGRQYNNICGAFQFHPTLGLRYARIDNRYQANALVSFDFVGDDIVIDGSIPLNSSVHSEFKGTGPVIGLDTRYGLTNSIGLVGHFDTSLLVGTVRADSDFAFDVSILSVIGVAPETAYEKFTAPTTDRVVTSFSGKVGLDYNYCFCNKSSLSFELGYQASKYFDSVDLIRADIFSPGNTLFNNIHETTTNNFGYRGPYLNVTLHV